MTFQDIRTTRRAFLAGSGLVIGLAIAPKGFAARATQGVEAGGGAMPAMNAFVKVGTDDTVTILSKHIEFGQGPFTGLATLIAEELDADWSQMRAVHSPADDKIYANLAFGLQGTGGSSSIANSFEQYRMAGATARAMLVAAAAAEWNVPAEEITVSKGRISHASGRESGFGALADKAAQQTPPAEPRLKNPKDFILIGKDLPKLDTLAKSTGKAVFTLDVLADNMLVALVAHPDHFGATVKSFDDTEARKIAGVVDVKQVPQGVAVYADNTFAALKGRAALSVEWDMSKAEARSSSELEADFAKKFGEKGIEATNRGNVDKAFADGAATIEADIVFPFLAHAPMEPLDAVFVKADDGSLDIYSGAQFPAMDQGIAAKTLGMDPAKVRLNIQLAGGSFGRRAQFGSPYMQEAASVFAATDGSRPLKHMWTREDDLRGGYYRPMYLHRMKGSIDADGKLTAWDQTIIGQSIMGKASTDVDPTSVEGASDLPYSVGNLRVISHNVPLVIPPLWWRSVGHTHTGFAVETFLDELLQKVGKDPVEGRLAMLANEPRYAGVLKKVAELADWGSAVPEGRERGVAVVKSFGTYVAQITEVSRGESGLPRVHKVWCAVDCGIAINPNIIRAQMEGGVGYGLGAVLFDEITLGQGGKIMQSNFHDYRSLRINEMPSVEVTIVESTEKPTGVGEPGTPPVGPAVANAWRRLTGTPVRRLPIVPGGVS